MKQSVSLTESASSARTCRSNQTCAPGLRLAAQLKPVPD
jgi:hypothetical protein